jgi:hypothetical protein
MSECDVLVDEFDALLDLPEFDLGKLPDLLRLIADAVEVIQSGELDFAEAVKLVQKLLELLGVVKMSANRDWSWLLPILEQLIAILLPILIGQQVASDSSESDALGWHK